MKSDEYRRKTFRDVPGYFFDSECLKLQELAKGKVCLEIGSYQGRSTLALAEVAKKMYAVDTFKGMEDGTTQAQKFTTLNTFEDNIRGWPNIKHYIGRSKNILPSLKIKCDFIFIDAAHDYESVKQDILLSWPKLKKGGLMVFHDYYTAKSVGKSGLEHPGVRKAVDELFPRIADGQDLLAWVKKSMEVTVVTMWFNEAFLAPFFLGHYGWVDKIHLLLDKDTNDDTREICERYANVEIEDFTFPDMMDDELKVNKINEVVGKTKSNWVFAVDADEFIFPVGGEHPLPVLSRQKANLLYAQMWQAYRHKADNDLDPSMPAMPQRCHGDPKVTQGINKMFTKPIIVRPKVGIEWMPGCHSYMENKKIVVSEEKFLGAHWAMVDVDMAIERRIKGRRERQSRRNLEQGLTVQHHFITEEAIKAECERHLSDPKMFQQGEEMKDVTIIVTTFERPRAVRRFLGSVRRFYPDIDIIVSDNGKRRPALEADVVNKYGCRYIVLPFDSGVSNARNKALDMVETKYVVVCDDDYEFTEQTRLESFRKVLESNEKVGVIAGELTYWGEQRQYMHTIEVNEEEKFFLVLKIYEPEWIYTDGVKYCYADHVFQFFMMRNVPEIRWDADLKCQWEHVELALRLKREGRWRMASTPDIVAKHVSGRMSKLYVKYRQRTDDWERFHKKTGFIGNVGGVDQPRVDSRGRRIISFPEYMYNLLKARNMGAADEANPKRPINNQIGG